MKGIVFLGERKLAVKEFPDFEPGPGQVVVKMKSAGICGSDLHFYRAPGSELKPVIAGHEASGVVSKVGPGVRRVKEEDRVSVYHWVGCGFCRHCLSGNIMQCEVRQGYGWHINGCDSDFILTDEQYCMRLRDELSFIDGSIIACAGGTAYMITQKMELSGGNALVVFGAGPVGLSVVLFAKAMGTRIIVVDVIANRLELAQRLGADEVINAAEQNCIEMVKELTKGRGADRIIDTSGNPQAQADSVACAATNAKLGFVGMRGGPNKMALDPFIRKQLTLTGSYVFPITAYCEIADFLIDHKIQLSGMVTRTFSLEEAEKAFQLFDKGAPGKFMFIWP